MAKFNKFIKKYSEAGLKRKFNSQGFTLVEMVVSVGLFTIVMFVATGALLSVVNLNKKAQAQQAAINNLNYALESMARSIRTGSTYHCGGGDYSQASIDCVDDEFAYESDGSDGTANPDIGTDQRVFRVVEGTLQKSKNSGGSWISVTDENIVIENLTFIVTGAVGATNGDFRQPFVRINISGYAFVNESNPTNPRRVDFALQTSASQRRLNYD